MEKKIKDYIAWYKNERRKFNESAYLDKSTRLKKMLLPYSNWDSEEVLLKESDFTLKALIELNKKKLSKSSISLAMLALSNRSEYVCDQSDFYVTYAGLLVFSLTVIGIQLPTILKIAIAVPIFVAVLYCLAKRVTLRREVAVCKELINIFKQYESKHA